jgi:hypothetical protein
MEINYLKSLIALLLFISTIFYVLLLTNRKVRYQLRIYALKVFSTLKLSKTSLDDQPDNWEKPVIRSAIIGLIVNFLVFINLMR